jgi:hypothetical protein
MRVLLPKDSFVCCAVSNFLSHCSNSSSGVIGAFVVVVGTSIGALAVNGANVSFGISEVVVITGAVIGVAVVMGGVIGVDVLMGGGFGAAVIMGVGFGAAVTMGVGIGAAVTVGVGFGFGIALVIGGGDWIGCGRDTSSSSCSSSSMICASIKTLGGCCFVDLLESLPTLFDSNVDCCGAPTPDATSDARLNASVVDVWNGFLKVLALERDCC